MFLEGSPSSLSLNYIRAHMINLASHKFCLRQLLHIHWNNINAAGESLLVKCIIKNAIYSMYVLSDIE